MPFRGLLVYLASILVAISVALLIRRVYERGSGRNRLWLTTGVVVVPGWRS